MSRIPDFANVVFAALALSRPGGAPAPPPRALRLKPVYGARDLDALDVLDT